MRLPGPTLAEKLRGFEDAWQTVEGAVVFIEGVAHRIASVDCREEDPPLFHLTTVDKPQKRAGTYTLAAFQVGTFEYVELAEPMLREMEEFISSRARVKTLRAEIQRFSEQDETAREIARQNGVAEVIDRRRIPFLVHVTRVRNLPSILQKGLLSRQVLERDPPEHWVKSDEKRIDGKLNNVCLSISHPNDLLFWRWRYYEFRDDAWVVLLLDSRLLLDLNCALFRSNAARGWGSGLVNREKRLNGSDLETLFCERNPASELGRQQLGHQAHDTTDHQAEVMVEERVPREYLTAIAVEDSKFGERLRDRLAKILSKDLVPEIVHRPDLYRIRPFVNASRRQA